MPKLQDDTIRFNPDWLSPVSDTIKDCMEERNMTISDLAIAIGRTIEETELLLTNELFVTPRIADKLAIIFGSTARFWLNR